MKKTLFALSVVLLSGCAATGPAFTPAPLPQGNQALVYIYRVDTMALGGRDAYFYVDDTNVADLSRNGYTWFHVPAGSHTLKQKWPIDVTMFKTLEAPVKWEGGKTYFYKFIAMGVPGNTGSKIRWELSEVGPSVAEGELTVTKYQAASGAGKLSAGGAK